MTQREHAITWSLVGAAGTWRDLSAATLHEGRFYAALRTGSLVVVNLEDGVPVILAETGFSNCHSLLSVPGGLLSCEIDGNFYRVSPKDGSWKPLSEHGEWPYTTVATVFSGHVFSVERHGGLYQTNPLTGHWRRVGHAVFGGTRFLVCVSNRLFSIEESGNLYIINPRTGEWHRVGQLGAWNLTTAATSFRDHLITTEPGDQMFVTRLRSGRWFALCDQEWGETVQLFSDNEHLLALEASGDLVEVHLLKHMQNRRSATTEPATTEPGTKAGGRQDASDSQESVNEGTSDETV